MWSGVRIAGGAGRSGVAIGVAIALAAGFLALAGVARAQSEASLACAETQLVRSVRAGDAAAPLAFTCQNLGDVAATYAVVGGANWLEVEPRAVVALAPGGAAVHEIGFATAALAPGAQLATLEIRSGAATAAAIQVSLVLLAPGAPAPWALGPGSQPPEVATDPGVRARFPGFEQTPIVRLLHSQNEGPSCQGCHAAEEGGPDPIFSAWQGSMMAHATRDPLLWAALAVAERAAPGIGDTCLRCHAPKGWLEGRSVPASGAALRDEDADGVTCQLCHRLADPGGGEPGILGEQSAPFLAADPDTGEPFLGNGFYALFQDALAPELVSRLGPYEIPFLPFHPVRRSTFQRSSSLCGTCHDVSNPLVGDHAPGHGALPAAPVRDGFSGDPQGDLAATASFRLPPYAYGVEQRTYSEWRASAFATLAVADFESLPETLRAPGGAIERAWRAALRGGEDGDYADGPPRLFTCQTCHMPAAQEPGCRFAEARSDVPRHDFVGGNHWAPEAIRWLDDAQRFAGGPPSGAPSRLRIGGGLDDGQWNALATAPARAADALRSAVVLETLGPRSELPKALRIVNLSGHKLPSGYPEGRRMWLRIRWLDDGGALVREDGGYGAVAVEDLDGDGEPDTVRTLLDPDAHAYEAKLGVSASWARCLVAAVGTPCAEEDPRLRGLGLDPMLPLTFESDGSVRRLGALAAAPAGTVWPTFHLSLNDVVVSDSRIPPYGFRYAEARRRNALPVPATRFLGPLPAEGTVYDHFDEVPLVPPPGAVRAEVALLYQTTSWEYVRFLARAGDAEGDPFLAGAGADLLAAWRATGMAEPIEMATLAVPEAGRALAVAVAFATLAGLGAARGSRAGKRPPGG